MVNTELERPTTALLDCHSETDEMFQNVGKKAEVTSTQTIRLKKKRANKQRGHGIYANDRPPIIGTVGRESGQVRLRVVHHTNRKTLETQVHWFTLKEATCYTDEWQSYNHTFMNIPPFAVQYMNGLVMTMVTVCEKYTRIRRKTCRRMYEITYGLSKVSIKII